MFPTTDNPYVYQVAVKNTHQTDRKEKSPQKVQVDQLNVRVDGCEGDYNDYRTKHKKSTNDRAVSIMTTQLIETFNEEGWPVQSGDLGENITVGGDITFEIGKKYQIGTATIQITEMIDPTDEIRFHSAYASG